MQKDYVKGSIWGLAYGDAWGFPYEFKSHYEGHAALPSQMMVSDDTQMSLYVMQGILNAGFDQIHGLHECKERKRLFLSIIGQQLVQFHDDPDNNRAPGISTMEALGKLKHLPDWAGEIQVSDKQSKGNGANIRAPWIGLLPCLLEDKECLAGLQAWITHGHPMAIYASRLTVRCIHALINNLVEQDEDLPLISWLQNSMQRDESPETHDFLKQLDEAVVWADHIRAYEDEDIAEILGKGATADNALVNALMVMDCWGWGSIWGRGLERLIASTGDADSTAAIAGSMIGAVQGKRELNNFFWGFLPEKRYETELIDIGHRILELGDARVH